jgi:hypothetical protein
LYDVKLGCQVELNKCNRKLLAFILQVLLRFYC